MHEWFGELEAGQAVLDLCAGPGSFPLAGVPSLVVALDSDLEAFAAAPALPAGPYFRTCGLGGQLPFRSGSFHLVVCQHGLEHIPQPEQTLAEIGRVLKPGGRLILSVPDGGGLCDGIYRWLFEGGGHVNRFRRAELVALIEQHTGLRLRRWKALHSSFVYLYRLRLALDANPESISRRPRRFEKLPRGTLAALQKTLYVGTRLCDRLTGGHLSVYGWALFFEPAAEPAFQMSSYLNVCLACGAGVAVEDMDRRSRFRWRCTVCDTTNPYVAPYRDAL